MKKQYLLIVLLSLLPLWGMAQKEHFPQGENMHRIMSYNIRNARGMDEVRDSKRIADIIKSVNPEVVALQEVDSMTIRSGKTDLLQELADQTHMYGTFGGAIPYQEGKYGIAILSKEKPLSVEKYSLPGREEQRALLIVELSDYIFCCTHLSLTKEDSEASASIINMVAEKYDKPVIIAGDFNSKPDSRAINELSKKWKILNDVKKFTIPADKPNRTIDFIMGYTDKGHTYPILRGEVLDEKVASDHLPLFVDIKLSVKSQK